MKIISLYEYINEDNSIEITPNPHNPDDISNGYRLIAENGMELYYNETNTRNRAWCWTIRRLVRTANHLLWGGNLWFIII